MSVYLSSFSRLRCRSDGHRHPRTPTTSSPVASPVSGDVHLYSCPSLCFLCSETSLADVASEHRSYLYSQSDPSSVICRGADELWDIEPIEVDQGCEKRQRMYARAHRTNLVSSSGKRWPENRLRPFTYPLPMSRDQSLNFCSNSQGTLIYLANATDEDLLRGSSSSFSSLQSIFACLFVLEYLRTTIDQLFSFQRKLNSNNNLTFFLGFKRIDGIQQWESNVICLSPDQHPCLFFNSSLLP